MFDRYADGDDYTDEAYIRNFRIILDAIKQQYPLKITLQNRRGNPLQMNVMPKCLEYSEKDDKFRLIGSSDRYGSTINLGRIISCERCQDGMARHLTRKSEQQRKVVLNSLTKERRWKGYCFILPIVKKRQKSWMISITVLRLFMTKRMKRRWSFVFFPLDH